MKNRSLTILYFLSFCCLTACSVGQKTPTTEENKAKKPNIIVVLVDDMGYSDLGCYGSEIETPNIDAMAKGGLMFSQFYNSGRCCPSRASLLTGVYSHQAGMGGMVKPNQRVGSSNKAYQGYLSKETITIAEALKTAGYATYMTGEWHVGEDSLDWPQQRGFDKYYGLISGANSYYELLPRRVLVENNQRFTPPQDSDFYFTEALNQKTLEYLKEATANPDKPFFMYVAHTAPHWPIHAPQKYIEKYKDTYKKGWDEIRAERYKKQQELGIFPKEWTLSMRDTAVKPWNNFEKQEDWALRMAVYAGMMTAVDDGIGAIIQQLKATNQLENTIIMFLSDNGGCHERIEGRAAQDLVTPERIAKAKSAKAGEKGSYTTYGKEWANVSNTPFRLFKHWMHEGGISTPMICYAPKMIKSNQITHEYAHVIDILPTCLEAAGVNYPDTYNQNKVIPVEGKSFLSLLKQENWSSHEILFWEHEESAAVRKGKWKLVKAKGQDWELYDMEKDRTETNNIITQHPEVAEQLQKAYEEWAKKVGV